MEPPLPPGIVVGEVDSYSSARPVRVTPFASTAVAERGRVLFWFTTAGFVVTPGVERVIETGGQVEKNPAELAAFATLAEIRTDPG